MGGSFFWDNSTSLRPRCQHQARQRPSRLQLAMPVASAVCIMVSCWTALSTKMPALTSHASMMLATCGDSTPMSERIRCLMHLDAGSNFLQASTALRADKSRSILLWVKRNGIPCWGRCTTHVRTYFSGGLGCSVGGTSWILTHGHIPSDSFLWITH